MTLTAIESKLYTAEEYFALEVESDTRNEFRNGEIVLMTGGTPDHNELIRALTVVFSLGLHGKPYQVFLADQRLWIPESNLYTYPDAMVLPRPIELQPGRTIGTFQEYLLIDQYKPHVEQYVKQNANQWVFTEYNGQEARVLLSSISVEIALADLYENIEF
jgi:Uma2 family endonuclease